MDHTVHGVAKSWTRLSNFHFSDPFNPASGGFLAVRSFHQQLFKPALWSSEKVVEAEVLPTRNRGQKDLHVWKPHRALQGINCTLSSGFMVFVFYCCRRSSKDLPRISMTCKPKVFSGLF